MKKFLSLLSATAIAITSFATVASAAITDDVFKPEWVIKVDRVEDGYAVVNVSIEVDTELALTKKAAKYTGQAITMTDLLLDFNTEIFDASDIGGDAYFGTMDYNAVNDDYYVNFLWNNDVNLAKQGTTIAHGDFWALLNPEYADKTAEELNAMEFATVVKAGLQIGDWQSVAGTKADIASFYSDGSAAFDCAYTVGEAAPVPPPVVPGVEIAAAKKTTDANWIAEYGNTMFWGVDFVNGGFNGSAVAKIFSADKERELNIVSEDADINGDASFGVFVIVGDSEDAIGLTVTSGDVTDTEAPVAYADAE